MASRHIVAIGGSDAGISAALRARELDPTSEVTVVVADARPGLARPEEARLLRRGLGHRMVLRPSPNWSDGCEA